MRGSMCLSVGRVGRCAGGERFSPSAWWLYVPHGRTCPTWHVGQAESEQAGFLHTRPKSPEGLKGREGALPGTETGVSWPWEPLSLGDRAAGAYFGDRLASIFSGDRIAGASSGDRAAGLSFSGSRAAGFSFGDNRAAGASSGDSHAGAFIGGKIAGASSVSWQLSRLKWNDVLSSHAFLGLPRGYHSTPAWQRGVPQESEPEASEAEAEQRTPPSEKVRKLAEEISGLTLLEVKDLTRLLSEILGLPDMPMGGMMMPMAGVPAGAPGAAAAAEAEAAEPPKVEKTVFDVKLEKFEATAKLKIIKEVRAITGLGLKESKELVESAPAVIKKAVAKEEAESIAEKLKALGAEIVLD